MRKTVMPEETLMTTEEYLRTPETKVPTELIYGVLRVPDLLFISHERRHIVTDRVRGVPDMVLEVLSPNPQIGKLGERIGWFAEYGVRECWLLHEPRATPTALALDTVFTRNRPSMSPSAESADSTSSRTSALRMDDVRVIE